MTPFDLLVGLATCIIIGAAIATAMLLAWLWRLVRGTARYWEIRCWLSYQRRMAAWRREHGR